MKVQRSHFFLLLSVGVVLWLTMPAVLYFGDNFAAQFEARWLIDHGMLGIPYGQRDIVSDFTAERGQYFFENDVRQKLYSKYGILNTLLYVPPLLVDKWLAPDTPVMGVSRWRVLILNHYILLFALLSVSYLYRTSRLLAAQHWHAVTFVLAAVFGTYLWHYLRAPTFEVFQVLGFQAFIYHSCCLLKSRARSHQPAVHLAFAVCWTGYLMLLKMFFVLLLPVLAVTAFCASGVHMSPGMVRAERVRMILVFLLFAAAAVFLLLAMNQHRFGSIFATGYDQWLTADGLKNDRFSLSFAAESIPSFFFKAGNSNVFIYCPLLAISAAGLPRFARRHSGVFAFIASVCLVLFLPLVFFSSWSGEWCYGPRYLLHIGVLGCLPCMCTFEAIDELKTRAWKYVSACACALFLAFFFYWQLYVISLPFFAFYHIRSVFSGAGIESIDRYFGYSLHKGMVLRDTVRYVRYGSPYLPVDKLLEAFAADDDKVRMKKFLDEYLGIAVMPNYFLLNPHAGDDDPD